MTTRTTKTSALPAILLATALSLAGLPATAADARPFRPGNGITTLDLVGNGTRAMAVVGRRENFNAHSFELTNLYVRVDRRWEVVGLFDGDKETEQLVTSGGADCVLRDFRFVRKGAHHPLELVIADRDYGDSFVDQRPVAFHIYALHHNDDATPGHPTWYYELRATFTSLGLYCDVGDAFAHERAWRD